MWKRTEHAQSTVNTQANLCAHGYFGGFLDLSLNLLWQDGAQGCLGKVGPKASSQHCSGKSDVVRNNFSATNQGMMTKTLTRAQESASRTTRAHAWHMC